MSLRIFAGACALVAGSSANAQEAMTEAEKMAFWEQVSACYEVPENTYDIAITVRFELDREGNVVDRLVERIGAPSEADTQVRNLYEAARAAILRCGRRGYDLPEHKYVYWQDIEMTFQAPRRVEESTD